MKVRTVLFVDDDEIILRSLERGLLDESYIQLFARSGQEALDTLKKEEVHVIVTDMCMPGIDGLELIKIVREIYPHIVTIVLSGYTNMPTLLKEFDQGEIFEFVPKPWNLEKELKKTIRNAVNHYNLQNECETVGQMN
jgi:two-component system response regulator HupR/HoxA